MNTRLNKLAIGSLALLFFGVGIDRGLAQSTVPKRDVKNKASAEKSDRAKYTTRTLTGRVVWMAEALARRHGIKTVRESADRNLALETTDGQLIPIVEDIRGRSFRRDKRLRGIDVELLVRQYKGTPIIQVIQIFALRKDGKYELDYWCETCAIAMFELKSCDCCQDDILLRERKVKTTVLKNDR